MNVVCLQYFAWNMPQNPIPILGMCQKQKATLWWTNIAMEHQHCLWENPLFLWPFSIAMLVHQRVWTNPSYLWGLQSCYPRASIQKTMERSTMGKSTISTGPFSIASLPEGRAKGQPQSQDFGISPILLGGIYINSKIVCVFKPCRNLPGYIISGCFFPYN